MIRWLLQASQAKQAHCEIGLTSRSPKWCSDKAKKSVLPVTIEAHTEGTKFQAGGSNVVADPVLISTGQDG